MSFFESGEDRRTFARPSLSLLVRQRGKKTARISSLSLSSPLTLSSSCAGVSPTRAIPRPCLRARTAAVAKRAGGHAAESRARPARETDEEQEEEEEAQQGAASPLPAAATETAEAAEAAAAAASCSDAQQAPPPTAAAVAQRSSVRG